MRRDRGEIVERGQNTWLVRIHLGTTSDGRRHRISKTIHGTRKDAEAYLTARLRERDLGLLAPETRDTLDEYLDRWLRDVAPMTTRPRTLANYGRILRLYVRPHLGGYRLRDIAPLHVQEMYRKLVEAGLSPKTIRHARTTLSRALSAAVEPFRLIPFNPVAGTRAPRLARREMRALSPDQAVRLLAAARGHRFEALFALALCSGMRPGEYLGLQWRDLDLQSGTLTVNRVLVRQDGKRYYQEPKTEGSRRTIAIVDPALLLLKAHYLASPFKAPTDPVFAAAEGKTLDEYNLVRRHFRPLLDRAALPRIRLYDLRHTHATLMLAAGVDAKVYGAGLGHSTVTVTLDTYTHVLPSMREEAARRFEALLKEAAQERAGTERRLRDG